MRTQSGKRTNGNENPYDISYVHRTLETEGIIIAREHSAAESAIFLLVTVLFCCDSREKCCHGVLVSSQKSAACNC